MKVTAIKSQINRSGRYSIFVDGQYAFSLSATALLESRLVKDQDIDTESLERYKQLSAEDLLYEQSVKHASLRLRSRKDMQDFLSRKQASPALVKEILNKLSNAQLLDDKRYAAAYIADRQRFRPTSRRKIILELRGKHISDEDINDAFSNQLEQEAEATALQTLIARMRKQSRYQNDLKLMQYLARQGFNYGDIKAALNDKGSSD